jgi:hypothetical protein
VGWGRIMGEKMEGDECTNWISAWKNGDERAGRKRRMIGLTRDLKVILGREGNEIKRHVGKEKIHYYPP